MLPMQGTQVQSFVRELDATFATIQTGKEEVKPSLPADILYIENSKDTTKKL